MRTMLMRIPAAPPPRPLTDDEMSKVTLVIEAMCREIGRRYFGEKQ